MARYFGTDVIAGLLLLGLAGGYHVATDLIPSSTLSDGVGADGLPRLLTGVLVVVALALLAKGLLAARAPAATTVDVPDDGEEPPARLPRVLGFLLIGLGYMLVGPLVGYAIGIALIILAVGIYEGARPDLRLLAVAVTGGLGFWLVFVWLLKVEQPVSRFLG